MTPLQELFDAFKETILRRNEMTQTATADYLYTDLLEEINSSAVSDAYYNTHDKTLAVVLNDSGQTYVYSGVPSWVWSQFLSAGSKGSFYALTIKPNYGPAKPIGYIEDLIVSEYSAPAVPMTAATVGTPKGLTYADDAKVSTKVEAFSLSSVPTAKVATFKHVVIFDVVGGPSGKSYTVEVEDIPAALKALSTVAEMLDVDVSVKAVTVLFE